MKKLILALAVSGCALLMYAQNGYAYDNMADCLTCHDFSLTGLHTKSGHLNCTSCHTIPGDSSPAPAKCIACHPFGNPGQCSLVTKHGGNNITVCVTCHTDCTSSCPAATVLGAEDSRLAKLRNFRDTVLAKSAFGKRIINSYYTNADAINAALEKNPTLKAYSYKALKTFIPVLDVFM
jgi:hypothetical protein